MRTPNVFLAAFVALAGASPRAFAQAGPAPKLPAGVVAIVNGIPISEAKIADKLWREGGSVTLDYVVKAEIVREEARKRGVTVTPEEIESRIADYKTAFMTAQGHTPVDWDAFVQRFGMANIRRQQEDDLLARKIGDIEADKTVLTDAEKARVRADLERAAHQVHGRVVYVGFGPEFENRSEADAKARADAAMSRLASGTSWEAVCLDYSDDVSTRPTGGDLGFVTRDQVEKPVEDALFSATPGPASRKIVRAGSGYVIVEALDRKDNPPQEADIQKALDDTLKRKKDLAREVTTWYPGVEKSYKVERLLPYRRPPGQ